MNKEIAKRQMTNFSHGNIKHIRNNLAPRVSSYSRNYVGSAGDGGSAKVVAFVVVLLVVLFFTGRVFG